MNPDESDQSKTWNHTTVVLTLGDWLKVPTCVIEVHPCNLSRILTAGYIIGLGDRHSQNILIDGATAAVVHIDLGIAFEQGRFLMTPELVPFRLTRDIVDGMGATGTATLYPTPWEGLGRHRLPDSSPLLPCRGS